MPVTQRALGRHRLLAVFSLCLASLIVLANASAAFAISRNTVLSRAQKRIDLPVPYSQSKYYAGYRTDCSGYVSMCWSTGTSWNTRTFHKVTHPISVASLKPGDALLRKGYHIRLFYGWADAEKTKYVAYESANGKIAGTRLHSIADDLAAGYVPVRYDRISNNAAPRNLLKNPTFDVWAGAWSGAAEQPIWWQTTGSWWEQNALHRKDAYRTARNALELRTSSEDPETYAQISQSVPVKAGAIYRYTVWARNALDPAGLSAAVTFRDGVGAVLAETRVTGEQARIDSAGFRAMSVLVTAPPTATSAMVDVRVAGSPGGNSVLIDDAWLARPQVTVGIKTSRTSATRGKKATLSGSVTPVSAVGKTATVYVKKPGGSWKKLGTTTVYSSGGAGKWKKTYTFKRGMRKGTYYFKASVPGYTGYLGATSKTVKVRYR